MTKRACVLMMEAAWFQKSDLGSLSRCDGRCRGWVFGVAGRRLSDGSVSQYRYRRGGDLGVVEPRWRRGRQDDVVA